MQLLKKSQANTIQASASTAIAEYLTKDRDISGAVATIQGRYPKAGFAKNEISKELVYVLDGKGKIITQNTEHLLEAGDVVHLSNNELFAWEGNFRIFMATAPSFDPNQHKIIE